jgi:hypothetical protein
LGRSFIKRFATATLKKIAIFTISIRIRWPASAKQITLRRDVSPTKERAYMTLLQAIAAKDHEKIDKLILDGQHPLSKMEMCIQMRGDAVATILQHVPSDCAEYIRRTVRHLEMIGRYPQAQKELEDWLDDISASKI